VTATLRAGRRRVPISHPDKVLFPDAGVTKLELARYYERVAGAMLPHVRGRPVAMHGFPDGVDEPGYYVKETPRHFPRWIRTARVGKRGGSVRHVLCNDAATLVYLAGQNVITPHVWLSRADRIDRPDRLIFDLDPSDARFADVRAAARALGELLRANGLVPHAMTTGSRGIHVTVPLRRSAGFDRVRAFARRLAGELAGEHPRRVTVEQRKDKRGGRIYVDVMRNAYGQHAVPPYAVRPRPRAPAAAPLRWDELSDAKLKPERWTVRSLPERLDAEGDPWRDIARSARSLPR
jgi:bifunctional non-homologous end joining protein LigD